MKTLADFVPFVKGQLAFHENRSKNRAYTSDRKRLHASTADTFKELLDAIQSAQAKLDFSVPMPISNPGITDNPFALMPDDLVGLPPELLQQLNISEGDKLDSTIVELINSAGGTLILDKILIGLFKKTGEIHQRSQIISRLYRMGKKGLVFSVPRKKGIYTTIPSEGGQPELPEGEESSDDDHS